MKKETKTINVYIAEDGTQFLHKNECEEYEDRLLEFRDKMRYFRLDYNPDLNETGLMCDSAIVAVYSENGCWQEILTWYAMREMNLPLIGPSVMGYRFQRYFNIKAIENYKLGLHWKDLFVLAPQTVLENPKLQEFLPPNCDRRNDFNYISDWGLKC